MSFVYLFSSKSTEYFSSMSSLIVAYSFVNLDIISGDRDFTASCKNSDLFRYLWYASGLVDYN